MTKTKWKRAAKASRVASRQLEMQSKNEWKKICFSIIIIFVVVVVIVAVFSSDKRHFHAIHFKLECTRVQQLQKPFDFKYVVKNVLFFFRPRRTGYLNGEFIKDTNSFFSQYLKAIAANSITINLEYATAPKWDAWNIELKKCLQK